MNMDFTENSKSNYKDHLQSLQRACEWLSIDNGRASQYIRLIKELFEEDKRSREHILGLNESHEITDIYELWKDHINNNYPRLKQKIKSVFIKGPILREDENPISSSNRPRNDAFVYLLAGKLLKAGINTLIVDGVVARDKNCDSGADIAFEWDGSIINIECKRPQTESALEGRVKEARKQLNDPTRHGWMGIIAVDCSVLVCPPEKLLEKDSPEDAQRFLDELLEKKIKPKIERYLEATILGFYLFARVPCMIRTGNSNVLSLQGTSFKYYTPYSIYSSLVIRYDNSLNPNVLTSFYERLKCSYG